MTDDEGGELSIGVRPASLEEGRPQGKVQRHAGIEYEIVQNLDALALQMVEQLPNVLQFSLTRWPVGAEQVWNCEARQVIDVPKISQDWTQQRLVDTLRQPQTAEKLVEVPTIVSYSLRGNVEQNVDIPVLRRRGGRGLQDFRSGQDSTAFGGADHVEIPARVLEIFKVSPETGFYCVISALSGAGDEAFTGGFRTFSFFSRKKLRGWVRARGRNWPRTRAHPRSELMACPWRSRRTSLSRLG